MRASSAPPASTSRWRWHWRKFSRKLWARASLFAVVAVATAFLAVVAKPYLPPKFGEGIGARSVDALLEILASSMLAVTTFSLGIMLSAFRSVASNVTPRAARLLADDVTTQNALATFLGAFLFSIVGIVALQAGFYGENGRPLLFAVTIAVIALIFVTFIRWIEILRAFGRLDDTVARVEGAVRASLAARLADPYLGGNPRFGPLPGGVRPVRSPEVGYVEHLDAAALSDAADAGGLEIHVVSLPGAFVDSGTPLVWIRGGGDDAGAAEEGAIQAAFTVASHRTFEQDPRFGMIVLAEIASRALSPAVNDPGTAIDILGRGIRILSGWSEREAPEIRHPRLWVAPLHPCDFFEDFFRPIARDGAGLVEIQIRLQKALLAIARLGPPALREAAVGQSREAFARAEGALPIEADRSAILAISRRIEALPKDDKPETAAI